MDIQFLELIYQAGDIAYLLLTLTVLLSIISALHVPFLLLKKPLSPEFPDSWPSLQTWTYQACTIMEANPFKFISFYTYITRWLFSQRLLNNTTQYRFYITLSSNRPAFDLLLLLTLIFEIPDVTSFRDNFPLIMQGKVCKQTVYSVLGHVKGTGNEKKQMSTIMLWKNKCLHHKRKSKHYVLQTDTMPAILRTVCDALASNDLTSNGVQSIWIHHSIILTDTCTSPLELP